MPLSPLRLEQLLRAQADALDAGLDRLAASRGAFTAGLPPPLQQGLLRAAEAGQALSVTFEALELVDPAGAALLAAAEARGHEAQALRALAEVCAARRADQRRLLQGLAYPALLTLAVVLIPPLPLIVTSGGGAYLRTTAPLLGLLLGLLALAWFVHTRPSGSALKQAASRLGHQLPPISRILLAHSRARFAEVLGACLAAGLDVGASVRWATRSAGHPGLAHGGRVLSRLGVGATLYEALTELPALSEADRAMIGQGEQAGKLEEVLPRVAKQQRERARTTTQVTMGVAVTLITVVVMGSAVRAIVSGYTGYFRQLERITNEAGR